MSNIELVYCRTRTWKQLPNQHTYSWEPCASEGRKWGNIDALLHHCQVAHTSKSQTFSCENRFLTIFGRRFAQEQNAWQWQTRTSFLSERKIERTRCNKSGSPSQAVIGAGTQAGAIVGVFLNGWLTSLKPNVGF